MCLGGGLVVSRTYRPCRRSASVLFCSALSCPALSCSVRCDCRCDECAAAGWRLGRAARAAVVRFCRPAELRGSPARRPATAACPSGDWRRRDRPGLSQPAEARFRGCSPFSGDSTASQRTGRTCSYEELRQTIHSVQCADSSVRCRVFGFVLDEI